MEHNLDVLAKAREEVSTNPMMIESILSNMFKFLDFEDLAQCRSVCKQWHKGSLPPWLAKGPTVKLGLGPKCFAGTPIGLREFLELVHNESHSYGPYEYSGLRQYKKFEVSGDATYQDEHDYLMSFLRICGHDVTELKLDLEIRDFDTYLPLMLSPMSPNLGKLSADLCLGIFQNAEVVFKKESFELMGEEHRTLTTLQIFCHEFFCQDLAYLPESGWIQLLKRYPNLKSLLLSDKRYRPAPPIAAPEGPARQPWFDGVIKTLLPLFRDGMLSLETLEICLGESTSAETIVEILNSQAATLKKLSLQRYKPLKDFKPPELPFVESLELLGRPIQDLASLSRFQQLKSLDFTSYEGYSSLSDQLPQVLRNTAQTGCILLKLFQASL